MEDNWLWYIAGAFDSIGTLTVSIGKNDEMAIGYQIQPMIMISRPEEKEVIFGMLDEYTTENGVKYHIEEQKSSYQMKIKDTESIKRFLEPIAPGLVQQEKEVEIMLEEIIPMIKEEKHHTKKGLVELMESVDELRESLHGRRETKYTSTHFKKKWAGEI
jgi:hypothetical protein